MRCVVNLSFDDLQAGEVVEVDPTLWRTYIDAGMLTEVDENGDRIVALSTDYGTAPDERAVPTAGGETGSDAFTET